jgi:predicted alpha/beta-hydrolase family hydrolase
VASASHFLIDGPKKAARTIALAHGAGAAMDTAFMNYFATGLADRGIRVVRFEFTYFWTATVGQGRGAICCKRWLRNWKSGG